MESYSVPLRASAFGELERLSRRDLTRVVERIQALAERPRPRGCEKLSAGERYRIRQGDCRIVYSVDDKARAVVVVKIGRRGEVCSG